MLSAIGAGTRPRAMRCAYDRVVWPLACSRRWAARNLTRGLRPPPACHALRLRSLRRVPRRSRACVATADQHAVFAMAWIVAVHASGLSAYAHGRRVVSEMETTRKGPMDMNDMVNTRTAGTGLAERVCGGFRKDRRELGPAKAADKWFSPPDGQVERERPARRRRTLRLKSPRNPSSMSPCRGMAMLRVTSSGSSMHVATVIRTPMFLPAEFQEMAPPVHDVQLLVLCRDLIIDVADPRRHTPPVAAKKRDPV